MLNYPKPREGTETKHATPADCDLLDLELNYPKPREGTETEPELALVVARPHDLLNYPKPREGTETVTGTPARSILSPC